MNYKKIIILPALFILSNFLYISCCKCIDSNESFYEFRNVSVRVNGPGKVAIDSNIITRVDSLFLNYFLQINCIAHQKNPFSFLINESLACKCTSCGTQGLKTKIQSIDISSDSVYNGVPANTTLNTFFKALNINSSPVTIDELKTAFNSNQSGIIFSINLATTTKPANNKGHKFTLKILFVDGRVLQTTTGRIYWL